MQKYIPADLTTEQLLYNYQRINGWNYDVFVKINGDVIQARTIEQLRNDSKVKIKFINNHFPFKESINFYQTSWEGFTATSFYEKFYLSDGYIYKKNIPQKTIELSDYIKRAKITLENNFLKIIKRHSGKNIVLCYSKGIDSLLLLSYLIKHNLVNKTKLVMIENQFYSVGSNKLDDPNYDFTKERKLGLTVETLKIDQKMYLPYINQPCPFLLFNYQQSIIANAFKNDLVLTGFEGNSVLLHTDRWLWQLGKTPTKKNLYEKDITFIENKDKRFLFLSHIRPNSRSWHNQLYSNIESPITDLSLLGELPFIKIDDVDPNWVANAELSRELIHDNVGTLLDELITNSGRTWVNRQAQLTIPLEDVDPEQLIIKSSKQVDVHLLAKLIQARREQVKKNVVSINVLERIKLINYILEKTFTQTL
jgi:phenolic acid decarboxylase